MRRVALTGGIATGKSYVRAALEARGIPAVDADALARDVLAPGSDGAAAVRARFGPDVVDAAGTVDRRALGALVFADPAARRDLEAIVHPAVYEAIAGWYAALPAGTPAAVADIPLLFETGREGDFDLVVATVCDEDDQVRRIVARDGVTAEAARARLAAQIPAAEKARRADRVIRTGGTFEETDRQVEALARELADS